MPGIWVSFCDCEPIADPWNYVRLKIHLREIGGAINCTVARRNILNDYRSIFGALSPPLCDKREAGHRQQCEALS